MKKQTRRERQRANRAMARKGMRHIESADVDSIPLVHFTKARQRAIVRIFAEAAPVRKWEGKCRDLDTMKPEPKWSLRRYGFRYADKRRIEGPWTRFFNTVWTEKSEKTPRKAKVSKLIPLTEEEQEAMRQHVELSRDLMVRNEETKLRQEDHYRAIQPK